MADDPELKWWQEDAQRLNAMADRARKRGVTVQMPKQATNKYNPNQPRDSRGRWGSGGGGGGGAVRASAPPDVSPGLSSAERKEYSKLQRERRDLNKVVSGGTATDQQKSRVKEVRSRLTELRTIGRDNIKKGAGGKTTSPTSKTPPKGPTEPPKKTPPKPPPESPKGPTTEWKDAESYKDARKKIISDHNMTLSLAPGLKATTKRKATLANHVGEQMTDMHNRFQSKAMAKTHEAYVHTSLEKGSAFPVGGPFESHNVVGAWYNNGSNLRMASSLPIKTTPPKMKVGKNAWSVGQDYDTVFRHEYGHAVWDRGLDGAARVEFGKMLRSKGWVEGLPINKTMPTVKKGTYTKYHKKHPVSQYAGTNVHETWAESFAAYTAKTYKRGQLPSEIESFMDKHIGGKA